jgi:hypothetical protein
MENRKNFWVNGTQGTKLTLKTTQWELDGNPLGTHLEQQNSLGPTLPLQIHLLLDSMYRTKPQGEAQHKPVAA